MDGETIKVTSQLVSVPMSMTVRVPRLIYFHYYQMIDRINCTHILFVSILVVMCVAVCQWFGVTCDEETRAVVAIELPRVNLSGSISAEIGILKSLNTLDLSGNDVYGAIPYEISQLPKLINLNLSSNNIEGSIETFHPDLKVLNVSHNELRGFEVDSDNLEVFDASYNRIGGFVPPSIGSLKKLKILDLGFNEVSLTG